MSRRLGLACSSLGLLILAGGAAAVFASASACSSSDTGLTPEDSGPPQTDSGFQGVDGGFADGGLVGCAEAQSDLERVGLYVHILLDNSGSMGAPISPNNAKWEAAKGALYSFFQEAEYQADPNLALGLFVFNNCFGGPCDEGHFSRPDVPIRFVTTNQANALRNLLRDNGPGGSTPLYQSVTGQIPVLAGYRPQAPVPEEGNAVLVVVTDGVPDVPDGGTAAAVQDALVTAVEAARTGTPPITTFAVGIGNPTADAGDYDELLMGRIAVAGGSGTEGCLPTWDESSPSTARPCHFQVTPGEKTADQLQKELLAAINTIRNEAGACEFRLSSIGTKDVDPGQVNVVYRPAQGDEQTVLQDPLDGWTYDNPSNPTRIIFHGSTCNTLRQQSGGKLKVLLGCKTLVK